MLKCFQIYDSHKHHFADDMQTKGKVADSGR